MEDLTPNVPPLALKRFTDAAIATVLAVLALPLTVTVLVAMAADMLVFPSDRGGFLYRERRLTQGREFDLLKLRTLRQDVLRRICAPGDHARIHEADAANLTWSGRRI